MPKTLEEVKALLKSLLTFALILIFLNGSIIQAFKIPSGSMIPTLQIGDRILVSKLAYGIRAFMVTHSLWQFSTPARQDIVVFTRPDEVATPDKDESADYIIKRVIGLPGETVQVKGREVFINGEKLNEPYARWSQGGSLEGNFGPVRIPEGEVLLLGDNRDESRDSRFWPYHFLPITRIHGRALIIYFSFDDFSRIGRVIR